VVAFGRFINHRAGFFPLLLYFAWMPYIVSLGVLPEGPFANGVAGIPEWCRWAFSYAAHLWPYFSSFIVKATFWVLVVPASVVVGTSLYANRRELVELASAAGRRVEAARRRLKPGWWRGKLAKIASEAASFPSTLAESFGEALVSGGWIHVAVTVVTEEMVSYPIKVIGALIGAIGRIVKRVAQADAEGLVRDVVWELAEFPAVLAAAVAPHLRDLAPTLRTIAELFVGLEPVKGHGVPDLKAFVGDDEGAAARGNAEGKRGGVGFAAFGSGFSGVASGLGGAGARGDSGAGLGRRPHRRGRRSAPTGQETVSRLERVEEENEREEDDGAADAESPVDPSDAERASAGASARRRESA
jgi:hypothetical protein